MAEIDAREIGRLRWRCRRGMRELDELLRGYLDREFLKASAADRDAFRRLLEIPDTEIQAYCLGRESPPAEFAGLLTRILASTGGC